MRQGWRSGLTRGRRRLTARQTTSTSRMTQRDVVDEGKEVEVDEAPRQPTAVSGANEAPRQPTAVSGANEVRTDWILKTGKQNGNVYTLHIQTTCVLDAIHMRRWNLK